MYWFSEQSFTSSTISDYNDTYNILYSLCIMPNNHSYSILYSTTQYPILRGNSWKLSELCTLICPQITVNDLQNLFDKIIVFQMDLSSIYHSFYIFITIICRGYIYIFHNIVFILFALTSSTRQIFPFFNQPLPPNFSLLPRSHFSNPSKSPLFLHKSHFSLISSKKTLRRK